MIEDKITNRSYLLLAFAFWNKKDRIGIDLRCASLFPCLKIGKYSRFLSFYYLPANSLMIIHLFSSYHHYFHFVIYLINFNFNANSSEKKIYSQSRYPNYWTKTVIIHRFVLQMEIENLNPKWECVKIIWNQKWTFLALFWFI